MNANETHAAIEECGGQRNQFESPRMYANMKYTNGLWNLNISSKSLGNIYIYNIQICWMDPTISYKYKVYTIDKL